MAVRSIPGSSTPATVPVGSGELREVSSSKDKTKVFQDESYTYEISAQTVLVKDRKTGESFTVWGDPHVSTSDGDAAQFQSGNATFVLPTGAKVTIKPTKMDANGVAFVDQVDIMNGGLAARVSNVSTAPQTTGVQMNAAKIDADEKDGAVLTAYDSVNDFFFANGHELAGHDPSARFGEFSLDGLGGNATVDVAQSKSINVGSGPGGDILSSNYNFDFVGFNKDTGEVTHETVSGGLGSMDNLYKKIFEQAAKGTPADTNAAQINMSHLTSMIEALSNIMKKMDDVDKAIVRNL